MQKKVYSTTLSFLLGISVFGNALAQQQDEQATLLQNGPVKAKENEGIETIMVTAEHRIKTIQKTAIAITAQSGADLEAREKTSLDEVILSMPNVNIQETSGGAGVFIRGIGSNDTGFGDPSINFNVDGVYQSDPGIITIGMFDIARVEVLRGPQGTLYGRNATAGSLNLLTNDPDLGYTFGSLKLNIGNYGAKRFDAMLNVPFENAAVRFAGFTNKHDGYAEPTGQNDADQFGGRIKVLFEPNDDMRLIVKAEHLAENGHGSATYALPDVGTDRDDLNDPWTDPTLIDGSIDHKFTNINAQLDWSVADTVITVIPSYLNTKRDDDTNDVHQIEETTQKALEARIASDNDTSVSWLIGAVYLDNEYTRVSPDGIGGTGYWDDQRQPLTSIGLFGQTTWSVSDDMRLTGGLRYSSDKKSKEDVWTSLSDPSDIQPSPSTSRTFESLDYKLGMEMDLSSTSLLYATVSTGYKSGGYQTYGNVGGPSATFEPEDLNAYEIGSKNRFWDNNVQANLSAFYYDYSNYQVKYPVIEDNLFSVQTVNAGKARIYGLELESIFQPTDNDRFDGYMTFTESEFSSFSYTAVYPYGERSFDYSGKSLPNAPKFTARVAYEHVFEVGGSSLLTARIESSYSSSYYITHEQLAAVSPAQLADYPSGFKPIGTYQFNYHRSDFSVRYEQTDMDLMITAYIKNIENVAVASGGGTSGVMLQAPRIFGVSVSKQF